MGKRNVILLTLLCLIIAPSIMAYELCENTISEDELEITEIIDINQQGETTWEWSPTETVEIEVKVRNKNFTTRNFKIELFFVNEDDRIKNITTENTNLVKTISLPEDETQTLNFSFQLDEPNQKVYYLYAKVTDPNNASICTSLKATSSSEETEISIVPEAKIIVIKDITGPTTLIAGKSMDYTVTVSNFGNIKEDRVQVIAYNANFGIRETQEIIDLEVEESKDVIFNITIPANASETQVKFLFSTEYDYNNDTQYYYQSSDKSKALLITIEEAIEEEILINQTQNQTTQTDQNQSNSSAQTIEQKTKDTTGTDIPYLWPIIITILLIITMAAIAFFIIKSQKNKYIEKTSTSPTPASTYVQNIQEQS